LFYMHLFYRVHHTLSQAAQSEESTMAEA